MSFTNKFKADQIFRMSATIQVTIVHHPVCLRLQHIEICKAMHECGGMNWTQLANDKFQW